MTLLILLAASSYWLAGYINQQQDKVAGWVSHQLGHPVEIGKAHLSWQNFSPKLALESVKVLSGDEIAPLLSVNKLYLELGFYDTLVSGTLRLANVTMQGMKLGVVRDKNGTISLRGLDQQGDSTPLFAELLVRSDNLDSFTLDSIIIDYFDRYQNVLTGRYLINRASVEHQKNRWFASGEVKLPAKLGKHVQFDVKWLLNESHPELTTWSWSAELDDVLLAPFRPYLTWNELAVKQGRLDLALDGKGQGGTPHTVNAVINATKTQLVQQENLTEAVIIDQLLAKANWLQNEGGWNLVFNQLQLGINDKVWPKTGLELAYRDQLTTMKGDFLRLNDLTKIGLLTGELSEKIKTLSPRGTLRDYQFAYHDKKGLQQASFKLDNGEIESWESIPGLNNLNAQVDYQVPKAIVILASKQVTMQASNGLSEALFFDEISGQIEFEQQENSTAWKVQNQAVKVANADLKIQLDGQIRKTASGGIINDLEIKLADIEVPRWKSYVPQTILEPSFKKWSKNAFQAGRISQGKIQLKGDLAAFPYESEKDRQLGSFDMTLDAEGVQLHYADEWPDLFDVKAEIVGKGNRLVVLSQQANIAGYAIKNVRADIDKLYDDNPVLITKGSLSGSTQQALNFIQNSPLDDRFGAISDTISAKGNSRINLELRVPLTNSKNTDVAGDIRFVNSQLFQKSNPSIALKQVNGELQFNNQGVVAKNLKAQWLSEPVVVKVTPQGNNTVISASAAVSDKQLRQQWPASIPSFIKGKAQTELDVTVSERTRGDFYLDVAIRSGLKGMAVNLPEPFNKSEQQTKQVELTFNQSQKSPVYQLAYQQQSASLTPVAQTPYSLTDAITSAKLTQINIEEWQEWSEQQANSQKPALSFKQFTISASKVTGYGQNWSDVNMSVQPNGNMWKAVIKGPDLQGQILMPKQGHDTALNIDLDRLKLSTSDKRGSNTVTKSELWPALDMTISQLSVDSVNLGRFYISAHNEPTAWVVNKASLESDDLKLKLNSGQWQKTSQSENTNIRFTANSNNVSGLLTKLGYEGNIEAEESKLQTTLYWPGTPLDFAKERITGKLNFKLKKGKLTEVEPGAAGRAFGLLSVTAIPRRLSLDFNELFGKGFNFRRLKGNFDITNGQAKVNELTLQGEAANIDITGKIDLVRERYDQTVKITPNVSSALPLAGAVAGGPVGLGVGAAIYIADKLADKMFDKEIVNVISYQYSLTGSWDNPELKTIGPKVSQ